MLQAVRLRVDGKRDLAAQALPNVSHKKTPANGRRLSAIIPAPLIQHEASVGNGWKTDIAKIAASTQEKGSIPRTNPSQAIRSARPWPPALSRARLRTLHRDNASPLSLSLRPRFPHRSSARPRARASHSGNKAGISPRESDIIQIPPP